MKSPVHADSEISALNAGILCVQVAPFRVTALLRHVNGLRRVQLEHLEDGIRQRRSPFVGV